MIKEKEDKSIKRKAVILWLPIAHVSPQLEVRGHYEMRKGG